MLCLDLMGIGFESRLDRLALTDTENQALAYVDAFYGFAPLPAELGPEDELCDLFG